MKCGDRGKQVVPFSQALQLDVPRVWCWVPEFANTLCGPVKVLGSVIDFKSFLRLATEKSRVTAVKSPSVLTRRLCLHVGSTTPFGSMAMGQASVSGAAGPSSSASPPAPGVADGEWELSSVMVVTNNLES